VVVVAVLVVPRREEADPGVERLPRRVGTVVGLLAFVVLLVVVAFLDMVLVGVLGTVVFPCFSFVGAEVLSNSAFSSAAL
jgi:hypothetical protein